ncbi:lasso peptide biosynthesis PqqD family chaperone [Bacillus fungorum]|uniref:lasso peptide biosynthesis PqqD family chaperone n=1 Tax=Bacillus fungorum TaxID=2039284 RepID=UPI00339827DF
MIMEKQGISLNQFITQVQGNIVSDMNGEKVMLSIQNGKYYNLGELGGVIWGLIEKPLSVTQLVKELTLAYEVEQSKCEKEVVSYLEILLEEGLIEVSK